MIDCKVMKQESDQWVEAHETLIRQIATYLHAHPELGEKEYLAARYLRHVLAEAGFTVTDCVPERFPTAFQATYGTGPVQIGFLAEYDALPGLGHGCGHNMLGAASLSAALGLKRYLEETKKSGTVVYFGCPGEEGGSGKAFMAKGGAFSGLDAAITWHPGDLTRADTGSSLANYQVAYKFYGTSAHAGGAPHLGRSALDALELMNMGVQFLREHVVPEARIHYAITNTGGYSPNVVQPYAEVLYLIRAPKNKQVEEIYRRVNKIAEGAAHMTETRVEIDFVKGCSNLVSNKVIAKKLWENLTELGAPEYTKEEIGLFMAGKKKEVRAHEMEQQ